MITVLLIFKVILLSVPNCYIFQEDDNCYNACKEAEEAVRYPQGSYMSQKHFDKSIELCPTFAYAYMEKAVPYLKNGDFITWKKLIDKAVELKPLEYLGYRGWCRYQFLKDYSGAIADIEQLEALSKYDIGYSQNGDYHLIIAKALAYKGMGDKNKAISLIEGQLAKPDYSPKSYDYFHLGVLQLETGDLAGAVASLKKQIEVNDYMAETYFYLAIAAKRENSLTDYIKFLHKAKTFYEAGKFRTDSYVETADKVYYADIMAEMNRSNTQNTNGTDRAL